MIVANGFELFYIFSYCAASWRVPESKLDSPATSADFLSRTNLIDDEDGCGDGWELAGDGWRSRYLSAGDWSIAGRH
jgi:hypothetical protein